MRPDEILRGHWQRAGAETDTRPSPEDDVRALERRYGVHLPEDFRHYLLNASPVADLAMDDKGTCWWPLARIRNIPDECPREIPNPEIARDAARYLFFADHMIWAWAWAIACTEDENRGRIAIIGNDDRFVADSFSSFVELYVEDVERLF